MWVKLAGVILLCGITWNWWESLPRMLITEYKWMQRTKIRKTTDMLDNEYDYVIVGAGSAGAILAARLSEDPDITVALMEAGQHDQDYPELATPLWKSELQNSDIVWGYQTVPQEHACRSLDDQIATIPRGKLLGGTSGRNGLMAIRGSRHDFDQWAAMGNKGWSYEDVLPYFKKFEAVQDRRYTQTGYRGDNGPIQVTDTHAYPDATNAFIEAAEKLGFKVGDVNAEEMSNRVMKVQANVGSNGIRQSTAETYLKPLASRPNLHVKTNALGVQVVFEEKRAVGVQYMNVQLKKVRARKEVILSAGAIGSPQILILSGVGPKEQLKEIGMRVVADLPVGKTLRDHVNVHAATVTLEKPAALVPERLGCLDEWQYKLFGSGAYSHAGPIGTAFSRSKHQPSSDRNPYLQYVLLNNMMNDKGHEKNMNLKSEVHEALYGGLDGTDGLSLLVALQKPASVGHLHLASSLSMEMPHINPNYLAEEVDVDVLLDGIRTARKIMSSGPLAEKLGAKLVKRVHPDCANETYDSDEYWRCYIRSNTLSSSHPTSTCSMGPPGDKDSVVDPQLRVRGVKGLRVVDASVMPTITSGNTDFTVMMMAERAADIIKGKI